MSVHALCGFGMVDAEVYVYWSFNVSEGIDNDSQPLIGNARHSAHLETALEFIKAFRDTCKLCMVAS